MRAAFTPHAVNIPRTQSSNMVYCVVGFWDCGVYCVADPVVGRAMTLSLDMGIICGKILNTKNKNRIYKKDK